MRVNSIKFKICVLYVVILGAILVAYRGILYFNLQRTLYKDSSQNLKLKANEISDMIDEYADAISDREHYFTAVAKNVVRLEPIWFFIRPRPKKLDALDQEWFQKAAKVGLTEDYVLLVRPDGEPIAGSRNMDRRMRAIFLENLKIEKDEEYFFNLALKEKNVNLRVFTAPAYYKGSLKYIIQVGSSSTPIIRALKGRFFNTALSIPIMMLIAALVSWMLVERILRPVNEIIRAAKDISSRNLSARVNIKNTDEEMKYLASAFNDMIARLEKSFRYIEEFNCYVVHELKTPLAIIKGESELALRNERSVKEYQKAIYTTLEEADRMLKNINDLLLLARLEYRSEAVDFEDFCLNEFIWEIYEQSKILASRKYITINIDMPGECINVSANKAHLRRLFFNILDNAIKFTPPEGRVDIDISKADNMVKVSVSDTGVGISEEVMPKIFNKFFRAEDKKQHCEIGSGLGLSIAQSIAEIHSGNIAVDSLPGKGTTFNITLPLNKHTA